MTSQGDLGRATTVYRLFDADDVCLYVGMTANLESRLDTHRRDSAFGNRIASVRTTLHEDRPTATPVESAEILRLRPRWNVNGRGGRATWTACDYFEVLERMHADRGDERVSDRHLRRIRAEFARRYPNVARQTLAALMPLDVAS